MEDDILWGPINWSGGIRVPADDFPLLGDHGGQLRENIAQLHNGGLHILKSLCPVLHEAVLDWNHLLLL